MRYVEVRRHTMRNKQGQRLSPEGLDLAEKVGDEMGPFAWVVTSTIPRAIETAVAMGYDVDEQYEELGTMDEGVDLEIRWPFTFAEAAYVIRKGGAAARFARQQADLWQSIAEELADGETALIITHGGIIELGAVACLPNADHQAWGVDCGYCEGIQLAFDGSKFVSAKVLRVEQPTDERG
jgi:broad specificity phosphatase PhoE